MNLRDIENALSRLRSNSSHKDEMDIDTDLLWQRVQPHIPQEKPNAFPKYMLFIILAVCALGVLGLVRHYQVTVNEELASEIIIDTKQEATTGTTSNENPSSAISGLAAETSVGIANTSANTIDIKIKGEVNKTPNSNNSSSTRSLSQSSEERATKNVTNAGFSDISFAEKQKSNLNTTQGRENRSATYRSDNGSISGDNYNFQSGNVLNRQSTYAPSDNNNSYNFGSDIGGVTTYGTGSSLISSSDNSKMLNANAMIAKESSIQSKGSLLATAALLPSMIHPLELEDALLREAQYKHQSLLMQAKSRFYLEIGTGIFLPSKMMEVTNTELQEHFNSRKASESTLEAWNTTLSMAYEAVPNFRIRVGLDYTVINETSKASLSSTERITLENAIVGNLVKSDGSIEPIYDDVEVERTTSKTVARANSYKLLSIPLELIYATHGNKLDVEIGLGIYQNISLSSKGFYHTNGMEEYDLSTDTADYLRDRLGMSLTSHVGLAYNLSSKMSLYGRVRVNQHLSSITQTSYGIDQKYLLIGVEIGARTHF